MNGAFNISLRNIFAIFAIVPALDLLSEGIVKELI